LSIYQCNTSFESQMYESKELKTLNNNNTRNNIIIYKYESIIFSDNKSQKQPTKSLIKIFKLHACLFSYQSVIVLEEDLQNSVVN